jgi:hypothetical protein
VGLIGLEAESVTLPWNHARPYEGATVWQQG